MNISQILFSIPLLILLRIRFSKIALKWVLLILNIFFLFLLQPSSPLISFSYWVPFFTINLITLIWILIDNNKPVSFIKEYLIIATAIILMTLIYPFIDQILHFNWTSPNINTILFVSLLCLLFILGSSLFPVRSKPYLAILLLLLIFIIIKQPQLSQKSSSILRAINNQNPLLAQSIDIQWIGYSYIAFRLIHIILDKKNSRLMDLEYIDLINYCLFFPSLTAGPIARFEYFKQEFLNENKEFWLDINTGSTRIVWGLFKKYFVADSLSIIAINERLAYQIHKPIWMWVAVFAYAGMIYFDFSGYTDIAIGIAQLLGVRLPENFDRPYVAENITLFWNKWHITLTQWFRAYFFNPLTRFLRTREIKYPAWVIILITQLSTMLLVGFWHGITWNFLIWGLWHGFGLFFHYLFTKSDFFLREISNKFPKNQVTKTFSIVVTFTYISIGWVWFALPDIKSALLVLKGLI